MTIRWRVRMGTKRSSEPLLRRLLPRVWLIGESNPYGHDPQYALYPRPTGSAGARLCKILRMTEDEYLATFERRNLLQEWGDKWSLPKARKAAADLLLREVKPRDSLVLCGAKVADACGFVYEPPALYTGTLGRRILVIPHPSGLSRVWSSDPTMERQVREAVLGLIGGHVGT